MINRFKADLIARPAEEVVQKHILTGPSFGIGVDKEYDLRQAVAKRFAVEPGSVVIVGSAKLGFSINPKKGLYRHFNQASDIDLAIISDRLFDDVWRGLLEYDASGNPWDSRVSFQEYFFQGWLRPDKLPPDSHYVFGKEWWEYFNELTARRTYGSHTLRAGIYKSTWFLERYQLVSVKYCITQLETP